MDIPFHRIARHPLSFALALTLLAALPASSAPQAGPPTQVWIDVATHGMAGMPDLGIMGGVASRMMGGDKGPQGYPQSRHIPAGIGKLLDIAMYNSLRPGVAAEQFVPAGLAVGKSLPLVPPPTSPPTDERSTDRIKDVEVTIRQYWGCSATVGPGQPKVMTLKLKDGALQKNGSLAPGLFVPDRDIDVNPNYALSDRSSMLGQHRIVGDGVPASLQFELGRNADFLPKIALESKGELADSIQLQWQPVDRSRGYFLHAMAMQDERNFVMWSSADVAGAGYELLNYLTGSNIDKWIKQKVLLAPTATRCAVPKGIFKPSGKGGKDEAMAALNMIAYGPETNLVWPERPADPKQPWKPEWNVRVRTKSTATAMLGMDLGVMSGMDDGSSSDEQGKDPEEQEGGAKKLLRGLLRKF
jgi:hypothetical protein